jgi:hypothetical protein
MEGVMIRDNDKVKAWCSNCEEKTKFTVKAVLPQCLRSFCDICNKRHYLIPESVERLGLDFTVSIINGSGAELLHLTERTQQEAEDIKRLLHDKQVVIVGGS